MTIRLKHAAAIAGILKPQGSVHNLTGPEELWYVVTGMAEYLVQPDNIREAYAVSTRLDAFDRVLGFSVGPAGEQYLAWDDLRFPAQGINPAGSASPPDVDTTTFPGTLLFAHNQINSVAGIAQMPHAWAPGTAIRPHVHWAKTTSAAGGVVWEWAYSIANVTDVFPSMGDWAAATSSTGDDDTADKHSIDVLPELDMTDKRESVCLVWHLRRNTDAAADTYAAAARLIEFDIHYQSAKLGTTEEYPGA
jgi:hypothetical protein